MDDGASIDGSSRSALGWKFAVGRDDSTFGSIEGYVVFYFVILSMFGNLGQSGAEVCLYTLLCSLPWCVLGVVHFVTFCLLVVIKGICRPHSVT